MKRLPKITAALFAILMIIGLLMDNDAGIIVASIGVVCGFVGYMISKIQHIKRLMDK